MFFSDDEDKAVLMYLNLIKKIKPEIEEEAYLKYSNVVVNSNNMNTKDQDVYLKLNLDEIIFIFQIHLNFFFTTI